MPELDLLRRLAPPVTPPSPASRSLASARLERRLAGASAPRRSHRRLTVIASPAVVAAIVAVALTVGGGGGGEIASAASVLREAAALSRGADPVGLPAAGQYLYVKSENVYTGTSVLQGGLSFTVLEPHVREIWLGRDGGFIHQTGAESEFLTEADRQRWIEAGRPEIGNRTMDVRLSADDVRAVFRTDLSTDPDILFDQLERQSGGRGSGAYREMFTLVADAFRESVVTPAQRAALYEVLARIPDVELLGPATDRAGRDGVAVAMNEPANGIRHSLILDPDTGILLAEQEVTLENNTFGVPAGRVIGSATYLATAIVDGPRARPSSPSSLDG
jgi:hypothetical protein